MKKVYTQRADPNLGPSTGAAFPKLVPVRVPHGTLFPLLLEACAFLLAQNALELDEVAKTRLTDSAGRFSRPHVVPGRPLEARGTCHPRSVGTLHGARTRDPTAGPLACRGISFRGRSTARRTVHDGAARRAGNAAASRCVCVSGRRDPRSVLDRLGGSLDRSAPARCVGARRGRYAIAAQGYRILREQAASGADRSNDRLTSSTGCRRTGSSRRSSSARRPSGSATGRRWFSSSGSGDT